MKRVDLQKGNVEKVEDNLKTKQKMDVRKTQKKSKTNNVNPMTTCNLLRITLIFLRLKSFNLNAAPHKDMRTF